MNKLTKAVLTGVAALGLIGGGFVVGNAPAAEAAGAKFYSSYTSCKYAATDMKLAGKTITANCVKIPATKTYMLAWR